jgi:O-antigen/teichoic acid export membrane protein
MIKLPSRLYLAASTFYRLFSGLLVLLILARYLTAVELGVSAVAIAVGAILSTAQDWGQNNVILREIGRAPENAAAVTSRSVGLRIVTTVIPLAILPIAAYAATPHYWTPVFLVVASGSIGGLAEIILAPNRALGRFFSEFCAVVISGMAYIVFVFIAASMAGDLVTVSLAMLVARGFQLAVSMLTSRAFLHGPTVLSAFGSLRLDLSQSASLAVEGTLIAITNQLDTLILANLLPLASVGTYQAGARFAQSVSPLASILSVSSIPKLAGAIKNGTQDAVLRKLNFEFFAAALCVLLGFVLFGPIISNFVYQQKYPDLSYLWPAFGVYGMLRLAAAPANVYFISAGLSKHAAWLRFFFAVTLVGSLFAIAISFGLRGVGHALCLAAALHLCAAWWLYAKEAGQWKVASLSLGGFLATSVLTLWVLG